jgi:hypothetical protein
MLEDSIKDVIEEGFEILKGKGGCLFKYRNKYVVEKSTTWTCEEYDSFEDAVQEFLKPND